MIFHVLTIFPDFFRGPFDYGVLSRARDGGALEIRIHDLRQWTTDRHRTVDDRPFGGGEGMLLKPEPIFAAVESIFPPRGVAAADQGVWQGKALGSRVGAPAPRTGRRVILLSAQGRLFTQEMARRWSGDQELLFICGRYEGVDERVAEFLADDEISVGDYVLSGGELPAAIVIDAVARLLPGVLGNEASAVAESFTEEGLLDCPQYTRPADFRGWKAPEVLLGGNHDEIRQWRRMAALEKTSRHRPELLAGRALRQEKEVKR